MKLFSGDRAGSADNLLIAAIVLIGLVLIPSFTEGALSDDVLVHDIQPKDTYAQNLTFGGEAQFVINVEYNGTGDNITVLLSNSTADQGWIVESTVLESSDDMFELSPGDSEVVRISIRPETYENGVSTNVTLTILAVRDSDSHQVTRTYMVLLPAGEHGSSDDVKNDDDDNEGITIIGFHVNLPNQIDSQMGRFIILVTFWIIMTCVVLILLDPFVSTFTKKTETQLDDIILKIVRKPIFVLLVIYGLIESLGTLNPPSEVLDILERLYGVVFFGTAIYTAYNIFMAALMYMDKLAEKTSLGSKVHHALVPALSKVGSIIFFFIGLNVILGYLGMDLALLLGGMTIMGLVIAFAAQDTLSNFFGGIFLIMEPNFKHADTIIIQGTTYNVKEIGMRTTQLYDISNHALVIIPNNILANEKIVTLTEPDRHIKMSVEVGVAYGTDVDLVENTLLTLAKSHPEIMSDAGEMPFVRFQAFGASSLDFKLVFWVNDLENRFRVRHEIMKRVNKKFEELEIQIPFPQRVVHMVGEQPAESSEDELSSTRSSDPFLSAPLPKANDPAASAEVKGDPGKPHEDVIREQDEEELLKAKSMGGIDSDGLDDGGGDGGGDGGDD